MRKRESQPPKAFDLNADEQLIGDFRVSEIQPPQLWDAALQTRRKVLTGFHLIQAVRPELENGSERVHIARQEVAVLAGQLIIAAVEYELPLLMAEIADELTPAPDAD